jgi:hypothetical protein
MLHERFGKEAINGSGISVSKNLDHRLPRSRTQVGSIGMIPGLRPRRCTIGQQTHDSKQSGET